MPSGITLLTRPRPSADENVVSVYRHAVRKTAIDSYETVAEDLDLEIDEVRAAVDHLIDLHLLRVASDGDSLLVPVDPEMASALLVSPMEREIYERRERIAQIRDQIDALRQGYAEACPPSQGLTPVESVTGSLEVRGFLTVAAESCTEEFLALQPGTADSEEFDGFLRVCSKLLERGITVRIVCQHRSRADLTTRMKIKGLADAGALVRTVSHVPRAAVVFDRSLAVLLDFAGGEASAAKVRNDEIVRFLLDMFNHLWDAATPLESFESGYAEVADDLQRTIVGLMAKGFTDEALARKLGMSVRTCRRHIAAMMHDLEAVSRFQAGVLAARRSMVRSA